MALEHKFLDLLRIKRDKGVLLKVESAIFFAACGDIAGLAWLLLD